MIDIRLVFTFNSKTDTKFVETVSPGIWQSIYNFKVTAI